MFNFEKEIKRVEKRQKYNLYKFILNLFFVVFSMITFIIKYNNKFLSENIFSLVIKLSILWIIFTIINYIIKSNYSNLFNYFEKNFYPFKYKKIFKEVLEKHYKKKEEKYLKDLKQKKISLLALYSSLLKNKFVQDEIEKEIKMLEKQRLDNNIKSKKEIELEIENENKIDPTLFY